MSGVVGPIDWGAHDGGLVERLVSVMLLQTRSRGWRRRPSRGDAGVDVANPLDTGFEVFQVKSFTGALTTAMKKDIEKSLGRVLTNPELPGPVVRWELVLPMDPSKEAEKWFRKITKPAKFKCIWRGQVYLDGLAASHPHVVDYYLRDGKARLEQRLRDLANVADVLAGAGTPVRPGEVIPGLASLFDALNREDPHYWYEFEVSREPPSLASERAREGVVMAFSEGGSGQGYVTVRVFARYPQATEDRPIKVGFKVDVSHSDVLAAVRETFEFGAASELAEGAVRDLTVDAPGGLSRIAPVAAMRIGPADDESFAPFRLRLRATNAQADTLSETTINVVNRRRGTAGWDLDAQESGGAFELVLRLSVSGGQPAIALRDLRIDHASKSPTSILPGVLLLNALCLPNRLVIMLEHGPSEMAVLECGDALPPITNGYRRVVEALDTIQRATSVQLQMPGTQELTPDLARHIIEVATLVDGAMTAGHWTDIKFGIPASSAVGLLEGPFAGPGVAFEQPLELRLPSASVVLGQYTLKLLSVRVENADEIRAEVSAVAPAEIVVIRLAPGDQGNRYEAVPGALGTT